MFFNSTSWMDGAVGVSQWLVLVTLCINLLRLTYFHSRSGIPPGQTFDYVVPINSSGQYGTYWAHAHSNVSPTIKTYYRC